MIRVHDKKYILSFETTELKLPQYLVLRSHFNGPLFQLVMNKYFMKGKMFKIYQSMQSRRRGKGGALNQ